MSSSHVNNELYYENFTIISLRILKYLNHYLNQVNYDQEIGQLIDSIIGGLGKTLEEYKGRNVYQEHGRVSMACERDG